MNKPILDKSLTITRGALPGSRKLMLGGVPFREVPLSGGEAQRVKLARELGWMLDDGIEEIGTRISEMSGHVSGSLANYQAVEDAARQSFAAGMCPTRQGLGRTRQIVLERLLEDLRKPAHPEEWSALSSGYRLEIERMQGEILDYLVRSAPDAFPRSRTAPHGQVFRRRTGR